MRYFWNWIFDPDIVGIDHGFNTFKIRFKIVLVFSIEVIETWFNRFKIFLLFFLLLKDKRCIRSVQFSKRFINTHHSFLFTNLHFTIIQLRKRHRGIVLLKFDFTWMLFFLSKLLVNWLFDVDYCLRLLYLWLFSWRITLLWR